mmetsp:Transcript_63626/g.189681  ORF Transcript_63626/g.189681 Transcript_63626/m.189681 type:complete len:285 (-) Transcript_63626:2418-3272(-)
MRLEDDVQGDDSKLGGLVLRLLGEQLDVAVHRRRAERRLALHVLHAAAVRPLEHEAHVDELATAIRADDGHLDVRVACCSVRSARPLHAGRLALVVHLLLVDVLGRLGGLRRGGCALCHCALRRRALLLTHERLRRLGPLLVGCILLAPLEACRVVLAHHRRCDVLANRDGCATVRRSTRVHEMAELVVRDDVTRQGLVEAGVAALVGVAAPYVALQRLLHLLHLLPLAKPDVLRRLARVRDGHALQAGRQVLLLRRVHPDKALGRRVEDDRDAEGALLGVLAR